MSDSASVYRQFKTLEELVTEAKAVIDAQRFEDPSQGVLFVEDTQNVKPALNGEESKAPKIKVRRAKKVVEETGAPNAGV